MDQTTEDLSIQFRRIAVRSEFTSADIIHGEDHIDNWCFGIRAFVAAILLAGRAGDTHNNIKSIIILIPGDAYMHRCNRLYGSRRVRVWYVLIYTIQHSISYITKYISQRRDDVDI